jgi:hypothetical protein
MDFSRQDGVLSPFLVHRAGKNRKRDADEIDDPNWHWTKVSVNYQGRAFKKALHAAGMYAHLEPEQEPTFHEIRGLGSRLCKDYARRSTPSRSSWHTPMRRPRTCT